MDDVQRQLWTDLRCNLHKRKNVCLEWEEMASIRNNETLFSNIIHINKLC